MEKSYRNYIQKEKKSQAIGQNRKKLSSKKKFSLKISLLPFNTKTMLKKSKVYFIFAVTDVK
jgi:hypothetical protein